MNVLVCNPPWFGPGRWGLRLGADPPRLVALEDREVPWPETLASATSFLRDHGVTAFLVDSLAVRESVASFLERIRDLSADLVAVATCAASLSDDLPLIRAAAELREVVVLWPGGGAGADLLLEIPGVRAVVCGEPERGLLAAALLTDRTVYPPDPLPPADLPRPYRDYLVHRYRYPLAGLPEGPQL
ncbi:MAG: hypothetical protein HUU35_08065, partial [Armatimonadetes bacterium]|nr:hypothetical protein [Armatimonadota bacterium]